MNKPIFLLLGLALVIGACDSDSDNASNTDNLTDGKWKLSALVTKFTFMGVDQTVDAYAQLPACDKDDTLEFETDGTYIGDEGATKCNSGDPQQDSGTWEFTENETRIKVSGADYDFDAEILELSGSTMRVKFTEDLSGIVTNNELTFTKI